ncbi:MAG: hypothetical protein FJ100_02470 [Deltaproteobacteria bacterium]|nr:hypothetical protein [Deltaproteobacteria bacterium]
MAKRRWILSVALLLAAAVPAHAADRSNRSFDRARGAAERALAELRRQNPDAQAVWQPTLPGPALVLGLRVAAPGSDPTAAAVQFARDHAALWGVPARHLHAIDSQPSRDRHTVHVGLAALVGGRAVPVVDRRLTVTLDRGARLVVSVASDLLPVADLHAAQVSDQAAAARALQAVGMCEGAVSCAALARATPARLAVLADLAGATAVWVVDVRVRGPLQRTAVLVDAWSGAALRSSPVAID